MGLITELQNEHKKLLEMFNEFASKIGEPKSIDRLAKLKKLLVLHLKKEDEKLYPPMLKSSIEEVAGISREFSGSMKNLSGEVIAILGEVEKNIDHLDDSLKAKLNKVGIGLKGRITIEEYTLFPLYEKFIGKG